MEIAKIRILGPDDAKALFALRRAALADEPLAFAASPEDDLAGSEAAVRDVLSRGPDSVVFGATGADLCGMLGFYRQPKRKLAHKATLWGMYVAPAARGQGLARGLIGAAIEHARAIEGLTILHISVSDTAAAARTLYQRMGFIQWGNEPDAIRHGGQAVAEQHFALDLTADAP